MPAGITREVEERIAKAYEHVARHGCVTVATVASALGIHWDTARYVVEQLRKRGKVVEARLKKKLLWCVDGNAAADVVYKLRFEMWRVLCKSKRKYISPAAAARLIAADAQARKVYSKFVSMDSITAGTLAFVDAALTDLLGRAFDRRANKKLYVVPSNLCSNPPPRPSAEEVRYKKRHRLVTFKVPQAMAGDLEYATRLLGVEKAELVRMAVERLLEQYRHIIRQPP
jgi:hypothetical protein